MILPNDFYLDQIENTSGEMEHLSKGTYSEAFIRVPTGNPSKILLLHILMNPWSTVTLGVQRNSVLPLPPEQLKI